MQVIIFCKIKKGELHPTQHNIMTQVKTMKARGRKPIQDKKQPVILYLRESKLKENGGTEATKQKLYEYLKVTALILICLFAHNFIQF